MTAIESSDADPKSDDWRLQAFRGRLSTRRQERIRANLSGLLVCFDLVVAAMVVANLDGPARVACGLAFCVVVPGWAIVGPLRLNRVPLELGLTVAASLCALMVVAQLAASVGGWHLKTLQLVVCGLCLPSLLWLSLVRRTPAEVDR